MKTTTRRLCPKMTNTLKTQPKDIIHTKKQKKNDDEKKIVHTQETQFTLYKRINQWAEGCNTENKQTKKDYNLRQTF